MIRESKKVRIGGYPELHFLIEPGFCWKDAPEKENKEILIVATEGAVKDWAAYMESPWSGNTVDDVARQGDKLWKELAEKIFPELAEELRWRP